MSYDWKHYLDFSEMLFRAPISCGDGAVPVTSYRVILSRVYYAAFHSAREFLQKNNLIPQKTGGEHEKVIVTFQCMNRNDKSFCESCKKIGNQLNRLKAKRVRADYVDDYAPCESDVLKGMNDSRQIITNLDNLEESYYRKK